MPKHETSREWKADIEQSMAVPSASSEFVQNLRVKLLAQTQTKPKRWYSTFRLRLVWKGVMAGLVLILIVSVIIGPQNVLAAFRSLFGYIPGIGLVQASPQLRLLERPVEISRDGITLTLEKAAFDGNRLVVVYKTEGLSLQAANSQGEGAVTGGVAAIVLKDGTVFTQDEVSWRGWATGYRNRIVFHNIPKDTWDMTLFIHLLETMPEGAAPQDWQVKFHLSAAPPSLVMMPVYELETPTPMDQQPTGNPATPSAETGTMLGNAATSEGLQIVLDKVIEMEIGYLFQGYIDWENRPDTIQGGVDPYSIQIYNNGKLVASEPAEPDVPVEHATQRYYWAKQTNSKALSGDVTIQLKDIIIHEKSDTPFQLDLGSSPQPDQIFKPNLSLTVNEKSLVISTAQLKVEADGTTDLHIYFIADPTFRFVSFSDPESYPSSRPAGGGGGGAGEPESIDSRANFETAFKYGRMPTGVRNLTIFEVVRNVPGTVELHWQAPMDESLEIVATEQSTQSICLTDKSWQRLDFTKPVQLPAGLTGTLLLEKYVTGQPMPALICTNLLGTSQQPFDYGGWSSLSPDGKKIVYIHSDGPGIILYDVATRNAIVIPGTIPADWNPIWSPDGEWIVFKRGVGGTYYRVHPDGTNLDILYQTTAYLDFGNWDPDGKSIIAQGLTDQGVMIQRVDLIKETTTNLFATGLRKTVAFPQISPDGQFIVYRGMEFGADHYSIKLAKADGSDPQTIADSASMNIMIGAWSPDGKWVIVTIVAENSEYLYKSVLIHPENCEVLPLPNLIGQVKGWSASEP